MVLLPWRQKGTDEWLSGGDQEDGNSYSVAPRHSKGGCQKSLRCEAVSGPEDVLKEALMKMTKGQPLSWWGALNEELGAM